ncbi:MAG: hypothetical protein QW587_05370, partial [Candidatus Bathyarchaeia archaeon]
DSWAYGWPYPWYSHPPAPCTIPVDVTTGAPKGDANAAPGTYSYAIQVVDDYSGEKFPQEPLLLTVEVQ